MKGNVGTVDRTIRIIMGLALIGATLYGAIGVWGWVGLIPLFTGLAGMCPIYRIFGRGTCCRK